LTATQQTAPSRSSRLVFQKPALVGLNPVVIPPKPLPSVGRWRRCSAPAGISSDDVRLINRLGRNGLSRFATLVVCDVPDEVADEHIVLGLNRCLLIANQLASNERADGV
jgi:hypothetical protein